jgi:AcrR family transcriptional regulator
MKKRKYTLGRRAEQKEQTRARIVDAVVALHEEIGPKRTTVSAIAERAGVERLTVYRHFPDDASLFQACSARFTELNPPPGVEQWREIGEPAARMRAALGALYRYYEETEGMLSRIYRDVEDIEALRDAVAGFESYLDAVRDDLLKCWSPSRSARRAMKALIGHALRFSTWQSLRREKLKAAEMAALMADWVSPLSDHRRP